MLQSATSVYSHLWLLLTAFTLCLFLAIFVFLVAIVNENEKKIYRGQHFASMVIDHCMQWCDIWQKNYIQTNHKHTRAQAQAQTKTQTPSESLHYDQNYYMYTVHSLSHNFKTPQNKMEQTNGMGMRKRKIKDNLIKVKSVNKLNVKTKCQSMADWLQFQSRWTFWTKNESSGHHQNCSMLAQYNRHSHAKAYARWSAIEQKIPWKLNLVVVFVLLFLLFGTIFTRDMDFQHNFVVLNLSNDAQRFQINQPWCGAKMLFWLLLL